RWLGAVHSLDGYPASRAELPDAGPGRYLDLLRNVRELTERHLDNPVLSQDDVHFLQGIRTRLDDLAANWDRLEEICRRAPRTLVHGDFNGKNIRVRSANGDATIVVFDWECAG